MRRFFMPYLSLRCFPYTFPPPCNWDTLVEILRWFRSEKCIAIKIALMFFFLDSRKLTLLICILSTSFDNYLGWISLHYPLCALMGVFRITLHFAREKRRKRNWFGVSNAGKKWLELLNPIIDKWIDRRVRLLDIC